MVNSVSFNPILTTNALGSFSVQSDGLYQGVASDDPAARFALSAGVLSNAEVLPMWGGVGIYENIPTNGTNALGTTVGRATGIANLNGFSVFNQAHNGVATAQSPVPTYAGNMSVSFYRFGSGIRLGVKASAALSSLDGATTKPVVAWDFTNQQLIPFATIAATQVVTAMSWTAGVVSVTTTTAHGLTAGSFVNISGVTPAGYNGLVQVVSITSATIFTYALAINPGAVTVQGSVTAATAASVALPITVLELSFGNSKTVTYDAVTNFATWNTSGNVALILI